MTCFVLALLFQRITFPVFQCFFLCYIYTINIYFQFLVGLLSLPVSLVAALPRATMAVLSCPFSSSQIANGTNA